MKTVLTIIFLFPILVFSQPESDTLMIQRGELTFNRNEVDVNETDGGRYTFHFVNTGTVPVVIERCNCPCGCYVVSSFPHEPILPGESGEVRVSYDINRIGTVNKVVRIITNIPDPSNEGWGKVAYEFRMKGEVKTASENPSFQIKN